MVWFKVDDGLPFNPKVLLAGNAAMGLWVRAGAWSMQQLTDGRIPDGIIQSLGTRNQADALVRAGLWDRGDGAWHFRGWNEEGRQKTKATVEAERAAAAERQRRSRDARTPSHRDSDVTHTSSHADVTEGVTPTQTRPDQTRPSTSKEVERAPRKLGTRLSHDWTPPPSLIAEAKTFAPHVDHKKEHLVFVDYWIAIPGAKGLKSDWEATWRNWMRRKEGDVAGGNVTGIVQPPRPDQNKPAELFCPKHFGMPPTNCERCAEERRAS